MRTTRAFLVAVLALTLGGCQSWFHPAYTSGERAILALKTSGIGIGSQPADLKKFSQVEKVSVKQDGMEIYQVYNPNPHVSMALCWFLANRLKRMELRYMDGSGVKTLTVSGGWLGIRDYLIGKFGPPSMVGPEVTVVATQAGLSAATANFNGVWIFSRVNRQLNYIAVADAKGGVGVVTVIEPKQTDRRGRPVKPPKNPPPEPVTPNPGF